MATFVETDDLRLLVEPGVSLMLGGYGLEPDALEWERFDET
jgi:predicted metallo-beta-lactamase superfamily hydrolase